MTAFIHPSKEASEVLQKYGIASNLVELRQQGLSTTLAKLIKLQKQHPEEIAKAIPNIRALNGVLAMNEERMKDVDTILNQIQTDLKDGTGLQEAFERMNSGDAATWANVMGEINVAMIELGKLVSPILMPLAKGFTQIIKSLEEFLPKLKPAVAWVIKFGEGVKGILPYLKYLQYALPVVAGLLSGLAVYKAVQFFQMMRVQAALFGMILKSQLIPQILASIPAIWAQTAAFLANPLFWIPAVIAAVVTAIVLLIKHWDKATAYVKKFGHFLKTHFVDILLAALGPVGAIINAIRKMPQILKALHLKSDAFDIKTENGEKNPKENPQVKGGKQNGKIEVVTTIDNRTGFKASTNTSLQGSNDLQLKPAS
jgi:hypothetical protein